MSAGFFYSKKASCPECGAPIHPAFLGDMLAHSRASGVPVTFGCNGCGATLKVKPTHQRPKENS
jgi:hypothetical protein